MTTPAQVEAKYKTFEVNYNQTSKIWNKETSSNCLISAAQKVMYAVATAFVAIAETLQNFLLVIANGGIKAANSLHDYFTPKKTVDQVAAEELCNIVDEVIDFQKNEQAVAKAEDEVKSAAAELGNMVDEVIEFQKPTRTEKMKTFANNWITKPVNNRVIQPMNNWVWQPIRNLIAG